MKTNNNGQTPSFLPASIASVLHHIPARFRAHILLIVLLVPTVLLVYWFALPSSDNATDPVGIATATEQSTQSDAKVAAKQAPQPVWETYQVTSGDTLSSIFHKQGFSAANLHYIMQLGDKVDVLTQLHPGDELYFQLDPNGKLMTVSLALNELDTLLVQQENGAWNARVRQVKPRIKTVVKDGLVNGPLSVSMHDAGLPYATIRHFVNIFHWKVDFARDMRKGATFAVIYEKMLHDGNVLGNGPIMAASLTNAGDTIRVYRYKDGDGSYNYYTSDGKSLQPSVLRTPVDYTRVSSTFSLNRLNPVLHIWRPHYGVDLASPMGTPIHAAADGVVKFVGMTSGYGRLVELNNVGPYSTRYGHMSRFAKGLKKGERVHQGQIIGYVGQSGVATGPHLHFEIRVNGVPKPPLKVALPDSQPLPADLIPGFKKQIQPLLAVLENPDAGSSTQRLAALDQEPITTASIKPDANAIEQ